MVKRYPKLLPVSMAGFTVSFPSQTKEDLNELTKFHKKLTGIVFIFFSDPKW